MAEQDERRRQSGFRGWDGAEHDGGGQPYRNLKKSGYFKTIELKETWQDESVKEYQAFTFTLVCEKQS